jgi:uncharacterized phage-like protein YoqJ
VILGVTGHRPDKIGGYDDDANPLRSWVRGQIRRHLQTFRPLYGISGMALGTDQDFAAACVELGIPFIAAVPFKGQELAWRSHPTSRKRYRELIAKAYEVVIVSEGGYENFKMQVRNEWVVDHCNAMLCVFDGSPGGTANTVNYADRVRRDKIRINPRDFQAAV